MLFLVAFNQLHSALCYIIGASIKCDLSNHHQPRSVNFAEQHSPNVYFHCRYLQ
eukprot:m.19606 g.19606  ORF g.19606 m.19606 type:complete len:54 (+) comp11896_c0_seq1:296-457(+)